MALSIVPVLLSLLATRHPAPAGDLLVHVVDKDGKPIAGAQVAIGHRMEAHGPFPAPEMYFDLQKTEAVTGYARFTDVTRFVRPAAGMQYFVSLGAPGAEPIEAMLHADKLEEELTLTLPDCGQVLLRTPCSGKGTAQLRLAPPTGAPPPFWRRQMPPSIELSAGDARFEHVGLGVELEYRIVSPELPSELRGTFRGPTRKGQVVEFTVKGPDQSGATLLATLLDAKLKPITDVQVDWSIDIINTTGSGNLTSSNGGRARSDDRGRIRLPLSRDQAKTGERQLSISAWSDAASAIRLNDGYGSLSIPPDFTSGELDVGEQVLVPFGDPARFLRTDDDSLRRAFEAPLPTVTVLVGRDAGNSREEMLCEMVRRGGPQWERYVAEQLAALRADKDSSHRHAVGELELLTALRRLQHRADPLTLLIKPESTLDVCFPDAPVIAFEWKNVDVASEPFVTARGGSYRSGRFSRCSVEALDGQGRKLPPRGWDNGFGGGMFRNEPLVHGESFPGRLPLGDFVAFDAPGEYRVRIHYHDRQDLDSLTSLPGRIVSGSEEFLVHILPREISLTKGRMDDARRWIRQIDTTKTIPLVSGHWHADMRFISEVGGPEDQLFRAGLEAVPALLEALEDEAVDLERRGWALGMLWNILGVERPQMRTLAAPIGKCEWVEKWPSSTEPAHFNLAERGAFSPLNIDAAAQGQLIESWKRWRSLIAVKILP